MKNWKHYIRYGMVLISLTAIVVGISACSSPSPQPSSASPAAAPPTTTAPSQQAAPNQPAAPAPSGAAAPNRPQGQGTSGTITGISANTLTLSTAQGQITVNIGSNVPVQETATGVLSDLQVGQFLIVTGSQDASGNITANTILLRPQGNQFTPPAGTNPGQSNRPSRTGNGQSPNFPNNGGGRGTLGTVANINGNTLTLTTNQGEVKINVAANTVIEKTVTGSVSDLKKGQSVTVMGARDASNNLTANSIVVRPANNPSSPPPGA